MYRVVKFNQEVWLKSYIDVNTTVKIDFEKDFYILMNNSVLERKWRISDDLITIKMTKTKIKMNKSILLGISILDISETVMYEHYYEHIRPQQKTSITTEQYHVMLCYIMLKLCEDIVAS